MASDTIPTSTRRICPAPLPYATATPSALSSKSCEAGDISGQVILEPVFSQVKMGAGKSQRDLLGRKRSQGRGWKEQLQQSLRRYLSFSPVSAWLPLRQSRRKKASLEC